MAEPKGTIAYLTGEYPRATDTFIQREVAALRELGWTVHTCSIRQTGPEHHVGPEQITEAQKTFNVVASGKSVSRLARAVGRALANPAQLWRATKLAWRTSPGGTRAHLYQLFYLIEAMLLADHLRREKVQHLHNHIAKASCTVAMLTKELSGIPYSFTLHGPDIFFEPYHWRLDEKIARAAFVACISDFCRSQGMAFSDRAHWERLHIVHCGIDPDRYGAGERTGKNLMFVGRLAGVKGVPILFDALRDLRTDYPELRVTLVGDGPERAALEAEAQDLSEIVSFVGYKSQSEVAEMLRSMDALVLPSFAEGVPVVLMEAMAAELPVITTRIAGIPELVEDGTSGLLVPPGDHTALVAALRRILDDEMLRRKMGAAGRAKVQHDFATHTEAARLSALIHHSIHGGSRPARRPEGEP